MEKRVGVAFSGGGGRGFFHIGAIKAFEEMNIHPVVLAGTSAGSLAALCWAAEVGYEKTMNAMPARPVYNFKNLSPGTTGLSRLNTLEKFLRNQLKYNRFEDLPVPIFSIATNLDTGEAVATNKGEIIPRILASCAIPVFVKPVEIDGVLFADGGLSCNLPARFIREYCDILIGINLFPQCVWPASKRSGYMNIAQRSLELFLYHNSAADRAQCDILITSEELGRFLPYDYSNREDLFELGYKASKKAITKADLKEIHA